MDTARSRTRRYGAAAAVGTGLLAGALLLGVNAANAADTTAPSSSGTTDAGTTTPPAPPAGANGTVDESKPLRPDETLLTGDTATKVTEAALARYPGATVLRVETDSDGVYEAHLVTSSGTRVTVEVGTDFAVTGEETMPAPPANGGGTPPAPPAAGPSGSAGTATGG